VNWYNNRLLPLIRQFLSRIQATSLPHALCLRGKICYFIASKFSIKLYTVIRFLNTIYRIFTTSYPSHIKPQLLSINWIKSFFEIHINTLVFFWSLQYFPTIVIIIKNPKLFTLNKLSLKYWYVDDLIASLRISHTRPVENTFAEQL
jgi:hypothetical protein